MKAETKFSIGDTVNTAWGEGTVDTVVVEFFKEEPPEIEVCVVVNGEEKWILEEELSRGN